MDILLFSLSLNKVQHHNLNKKYKYLFDPRVCIPFNIVEIFTYPLSAEWRRCDLIRIFQQNRGGSFVRYTLEVFAQSAINTLLCKTNAHIQHKSGILPFLGGKTFSRVNSVRKTGF